MLPRKACPYPKKLEHAGKKDEKLVISFKIVENRRIILKKKLSIDKKNTNVSTHELSHKLSSWKGAENTKIIIKIENIFTMSNRFKMANRINASCKDGDYHQDGGRCDKIMWSRSEDHSDGIR